MAEDVSPPRLRAQLWQLSRTLLSRIFGQLLRRQPSVELKKPEQWRWYKVLHMGFARILLPIMYVAFARFTPWWFVWTIFQVIHFYPLKRLVYDTDESVTTLTTTYHLSMGRWDRLSCTTGHSPLLYRCWLYGWHGGSHLHMVLLIVGIALALYDAFCHPDIALSQRSLTYDLWLLYRSGRYYCTYLLSLICGSEPPPNDIDPPRFPDGPVPNFLYTSVWWMACVYHLLLALVGVPLSVYRSLLQLPANIDLSESVSELFTGERATLQSLLQSESTSWTPIPLWLVLAALQGVAFVAFAKAHVGEMYGNDRVTRENKFWYRRFALCPDDDDGGHTVEAASKSDHIHVDIHPSVSTTHPANSQQQHSKQHQRHEEVKQGTKKVYTVNARYAGLADEPVLSPRRPHKATACATSTEFVSSLRFNQY